MKELIQDLCNKLLYDTANETDNFEEDILAGYKMLLNNWISNYENYRSYFGVLLSCSEKNFDKALVYCLHTYIHTFEDVVKLPVIESFDSSILEIDPSDNVVENYRSILTKSIGKQSEYRLSALHVETGQLTEQDLKELIGVIIDKLERDAGKITWDSNQFNNTILELSIARGLCNKFINQHFFIML